MIEFGKIKMSDTQAKLLLGWATINPFTMGFKQTENIILIHYIGNLWLLLDTANNLLEVMNFNDLDEMMEVLDPETDSGKLALSTSTDSIFLYKGDTIICIDRHEMDTINKWDRAGVCCTETIEIQHVSDGYHVEATYKLRHNKLFLSKEEFEWVINRGSLGIRQLKVLWEKY
jgi:hypothetical protein